VVVALLGDAPIERADAFSTVIADRPFVLTVPSRSCTVLRHRFTCAHELGHLVMHRQCPPGDGKREREADAFAAELLTPAHEMTALLPQRVDLPALSRLGMQYGVSVQSLLLRMGELRVVSDASVRRAHQRLAAARVDDEALEVSGFPGEVPSMLTLALELAEREGAGVRDIAGELRWSESRLRQLLGLQDARPQLALVPPP
jgi:Zn-dependent peptidase ImmA (M78 family)